jgi:hypothetical protein
MSDMEIHPALARRREKRRKRQGGKALDPTINHLRDLREAVKLRAPLAVDEQPEEEPSRDRKGDIRAEIEAHDEAVKNDVLDAAYDAAYDPGSEHLDVPDEEV